MVEDFGEYLADKAAEDPLWVECPTCEGRRTAKMDFGDAVVIVHCPTCNGVGEIRNPQLEP